MIADCQRRVTQDFFKWESGHGVPLLDTGFAGFAAAIAAIVLSGALTAMGSVGSSEPARGRR